MSEVIEMRYRVTGMDCPSCATKIEKAARQIAGIQDVKVSMSSQIMILRSHSDSDFVLAENTINQLGYHLDRIENQNDDDLPKDMAHITPAYKRALWIVVILNVGYGILEIVGGFLSGSQALKADALDFLGDGLITFAGLVAIGWSLVWRARAALLQGLFLGILGLIVLIMTAYRVLVLSQPNAELMGLFGAVALCVNIAAAAVLFPHRSGDANTRAVWLFSRNDAINNVAVVVAAGLVAWTQTPWPDLLVAVVVAVIFVHSANVIIRDARLDLRKK